MSRILTAVPCKWVVNIADRYPAAEIGRCHRSRFCHEEGPVVLLTETPRTRLGAIFNHLAYLLPNGQRWIRQTRIQPWSANRNSERRLAERAEARNEKKNRRARRSRRQTSTPPGVRDAMAGGAVFPCHLTVLSAAFSRDGFRFRRFSTRVVLPLCAGVRAYNCAFLFQACFLVRRAITS